MRKFIFALAIGVGLLQSCSKSDDSNGTGSVGNYLPLATNNSWTYNTVNTSASGTTNGSFTLTVTGKDTTINSHAYKVLASSDGTFNYWGKSGNDYYRYGTFPGVAFIGSIEELYLKDNVSANGGWNSTIPVNYGGTTVNVDAAYVIASTNGTLTVNGKAYSKVTKVNLALSTTLPFVGAKSLGSGEFYYADGYGLIKMNVTIVDNTAILGIPGGSIQWELQSSVIH